MKVSTAFAPDIRKKFPWYLHLAVLDSQRNIDKQTDACLMAAREHFGVISDDETSADAAPRLSLADVLDLSRKGHDLGWADFEKYDHTDVGSGLYIWRFEIDELFTLMIGGGSPDPEAEPWYIRLAASDGTDAYIDIRDGSVMEFIDLHKDHPV